MSRVLITGGTGFLGAWVSLALIGQGHQVRVLDLAPQPGNLDFVQDGLSGKVEIRQGDIRDLDAVDAAIAGCDAVVHLAGLMTVDCAADPIRAIAINLTASQYIIASAIRQGIGRLVYASTGAVYGPDDPVNPAPMSHYGALKLALEGFARVAARDHGLRSVGFRPYIVYGPGESSGLAAGPSIALRAAATGQPAQIGFSGNVGFVHVCDVAAAMAAAIAAPVDGVQVIDMGGEYGSVAGFVDQLRMQSRADNITITGAPFRMPDRLAGGDHAAWFDALPVTGVTEGIEITLAHWAARMGRAAFTKAGG